MTWLECNHLQREDVRLTCAQTPELFFDLPVPFQLAKEQKKNYANFYRKTINDGDSQTPLPIFPEGVGTSAHRLTSSARKNNYTSCRQSSKTTDWLVDNDVICLFCVTAPARTREK